MFKPLLATVLTLSSVSAFAASAAGDWVNLEEGTGKQQAIIHITESPSGELTGKITKLVLKPGAKCKCSGDRNGKPIEGMKILWGLKKTGEGTWEDGKVFDPSKDKTYSGNAKLANGGDELKLRGYIGVSMLGRTKTWYRVK